MLEDALLARLARPPKGEWQGEVDVPSETELSELLDRTPRSLHPWLAHCAYLRFGEARLPRSVVDTFDTALRGATVGHMQRQALLRRLLPALDAVGIPYVVLKGAALAFLAYPAPALRPMGDLDLWIRPDDIDHAVSVAASVGLFDSSRYRARTPTFEDPRAATRVLEAHDFPLVVEVHTVLRSLAGLSEEWLDRAWSRRERCRFGTLEGSVLHPSDMLTHLVVHASRHHHFEAGFRPLVDVRLWLEAAGDRIDWELLLGEWERERVTVWALVTLVLAHELVAAPLPSRVREAVGRLPAFEVVSAAARDQVFGAGLVVPRAVGHLLRSTPRERMGWLARRVTVWYWKGPPGTRRLPTEVLREALRRMAHDVWFKSRPYLSGVFSGDLWGAEYRRRRALVVGRQRLAELVSEAEGRGEGAQGPDEGPALASRADGV